jgi:hypothetical protein
MSKRKIGDVLWLALVYAKSDRLSFIVAYSGDTNEEVVRDALSEIKAFEALQIRLFGTSKTELQAKLDRMTPVSILKLKSEEIETG